MDSGLTDNDNGGALTQCPMCNEPTKKLTECANCHVKGCDNCITLGPEPICLGCQGLLPSDDENEDYSHDADFEYEDKEDYDDGSEN